MKKKTLLMMVLLLAVFGMARAQSELTVCDGTDNNEYVPFYGYYADAAQHNQMIFPATDLSAMNGKNISQMVFYIDQSANNGSYTAADRLGTWTVSLGETTATTLTGLDNATTVTQVYEGYFDCSTGTLTLAFDNDYIYNGGNLLVDLTHAAAGWNRWYFLGVAAEGASYCYNGQRNFLPKTTFSFTTPASCAKPSGLAFALTEGNGTVATLSWTENGDATAWQICLNDDEDNLIDVTQNPYQLTGLTPETEYTAKVRANCGSEQSGWSAPVSFTPTDALMLTVNDGTTTNEYVPIYGYWADNITKSQFIIPEDDVVDMLNGTISKLTFYSSNAAVSWGVAEFEVYMTTTSETVLSELADYGTMDKVMNAGSLSISGNKMEVTLDSPYEYLGGNLMIGFLQTTSGTYNRSYWYGVSAASGASYGGYGSSVSAKAFLPKVTFDYEPGDASACRKPTGLTINYEGGLTAEVTWNGDASSYNIDVNGTVTTGVTSPYTLSGLALSTDYEVMVQAVCDDETSGWTNSVSFTTDDCMPDEMTVVYYQLTDSYGDGWNGNYILIVDGECNIVDALTIESGSSATGTLKVCGDYISFMWYMGNYPGETSWVFYDAEGNILFSGTGTASMASYDEMYVIDNSPAPRPSDLEVVEVGPYGAILSWTENGSATAWQIGTFDDDENLIRTFDADSNPFMLEGLEPETYYYVKVRSVTSEGESDWPCLGVDFTTLEACAAPAELNVTLTPISATVDWTDFEGAYDIEWAVVEEYEPSADALWLQYDNETVVTNVGNSTVYEWTWGVMYPDSLLNGNSYLNKVAFYESSYYLADAPITINIYGGGSNAPETLLYTQGAKCLGTVGVHEVVLTSPVAIDPSQNLWITLTTTTIDRPMAMCAVNEANGRWVNNGGWMDIGTALASVSTYSFMIRGFIDSKAPTYDWHSETEITPPYTIEGLESETDYIVRVKASCGTDWAYTNFTTPSPCGTPFDLEATEITDNSVTLNWTSYQDSYNVQYRTAASYTPIWEEDFENGIPSTWTIAHGEDATAPSGGYWYTINPINGLEFAAYSGTYVASSWSWNNSAYQADNWLITPQLDLQGVLKYYVRTNTGYPDSYEVLLSTTTADTASFTITLQEMAPAPAVAQWTEVIIDLRAYEGQQGYIAIHHVDYDMNYLCIDDFGLYEYEEPGEWITATSTEATFAINGLDCETDYEWQVQGVKTVCDGGLTEWSEIAEFTTTTIADIYIEGFTVPAWGEHPDFTMNVPTDANYSIVDMVWYAWDGTNEVELTEEDSFDHEDYDYFLYYYIEPQCGLADEVTIYFNDDAAVSEYGEYDEEENLYWGWTIYFNVTAPATEGEQTLDLATGWNWWSSSLEMDATVEGALKEAIATTNTNATIKSMTGNIMLENGTWSTGLTLNNESMYMIQVENAVTATLNADAANPALHPITLNPGWNWIGFPSAQAMTLTEALAGITPNEEDVIKGSVGNATYTAEYGWNGSLTSLEPGMGYMYLNGGTSALTLTYPAASKGFVRSLPMERYWMNDTHRYATNMVMLATLDADRFAMAAGNYEIGAFVGDECRGSVRLQQVGSHYIAYLTISGDNSETVRFYLYDVTNAKELGMAEEQMTYVANAVTGTTHNPVVLHFRSTGVGEGDHNMVSVYPNPTKDKVMVEGDAIETVKVYNVLGQLVQMEQCGNASNVELHLNGLSAGVYTVEVTNAYGTVNRRIVKE